MASSKIKRKEEGKEVATICGLSCILGSSGTCCTRPDTRLVRFLQRSHFIRLDQHPTMASSKIKRKEEGKEVAISPVEVKFLQGEEVVVSQKRTLITYRDPVPGSETSGTPLYYGSVHDIMSGCHPGGQWVVMRRRPLQDAHVIVSLLNSYEHPNILKPYGVWADYEKDLAYITFPLLDGTLSQLPVEELFHVETVNENTYLQGFTKHGFKAFRQIINVVQYVNGRYGASSGGSGNPAFPLLPLQLGVERIFYEKIITGEYYLLLGDFYTRESNHWPASLPRNPPVNDIRRENWNGVGNYLKTLMENCIANAELCHLVAVLANPYITIDDLLWEPALWEAKLKMRFIREIYWWHSPRSLRLGCSPASTNWAYNTQKQICWVLSLS